MSLHTAASAFSHTSKSLPLLTIHTPRGAHMQTAQRTQLQPLRAVSRRTPVLSSCRDSPSWLLDPAALTPTSRPLMAFQGCLSRPSTKPRQRHAGSPSSPTPTHHLPAPREGDGAAPRTSVPCLSGSLGPDASRALTPRLHLASPASDSEWQGRGLGLPQAEPALGSAGTSVSGVSALWSPLMALDVPPLGLSKTPADS